MSTLQLLIVEDNPGDARLIQAYLDDGTGRFEFVHVDRLSRAVEKLRDEMFDAVLLDLSLPDAQGLETFTMLQSRAPGVPILVLTGLDDESVAVRAVEKGAQDYLVKGPHLEPLLARAIRYSVERHRLQAELRGLAIIDGVTGLYNGRGFLIVAEHVLRLADKLGRGACLGLVDVEARGADGELWLMEFAGRINASLGDCDVAGRIGERRFAVVAVSGDAGEAALSLDRVRAAIASWEPADLGLSARFGFASSGGSRAVGDMIAEAEASMGKAVGA